MQVEERLAGDSVLQGPALRYAGWLKRACAAAIDAFALNMLGLVVLGPVRMEAIYAQPGSVDIRTLLVQLGLVWTYYCAMESGKWQATLGKRAMGLVVTDMNGHRLTMGRTTMRFLCKMLSGIPLFFLISLVRGSRSREKQALHDWVVGSLVLSRAAR